MLPTNLLSKKGLALALALMSAALVLLFACGSTARTIEPATGSSGTAIESGEAGDALLEEEGEYVEVPPLPLIGKPEGWISPVEKHGRLSVKGTQLVDARGNPVQLKGISSSNLAAFDQFVSEEAIAELAYDWKIDVLRLAVYTFAAHGGYYASPRIGDVAIEAARLCGTYGIYCIIDWHILVDGNPLDTLDKASEYFELASSTFGDSDHVIYEICNEPNGPAVTWSGAIKPYAEKMVPLIRKNAPNSVIIVGTAGYSQDVDDAALNPLSYPNIMYAMHFYAGTHGQYLRDKTAKALKKIAIFSTEWGTSVADGGKDMVVYKAETRTWLDFLDANKISWCNWQLCDQAGESSSIIDSSLPWEGKRLYERLSESGAFVRDEILRGR